jgi:hypothetical protein
MATTAPKPEPDHPEPAERPTLVPDPLDSSRQARETYPVDPTRGHGAFIAAHMGVHLAYSASSARPRLRYDLAVSSVS